MSGLARVDDVTVDVTAVEGRYKSNSVVKLPPAAAKRRIDVEALLVWAYRDECVDCLGDPDSGGLASSWSALGTMVDDGLSLGAARGTFRGETDPDAIAVHRVVLWLDQQPRPPALGASLAWLLIDHARRGERPGLGEGLVARLVPVLSERGQPLIKWYDRYRNYGECVLRLDDPAPYIAFCRQAYAAWREGLRLVALRLRADHSLRRHHVLLPKAPRIVLDPNANP